VNRKLLSGAAVYVVAAALALGVVGVLLAALGYNVPRAMYALLFTSFRSAFGFQETVKKMVPLLFATYAFTIPFTIRLFNIGAVGQMTVGGTAAAATALALALAGIRLPAIIMVPLVATVGAVAGGLLAWVAGWLRARHDVNPIISTIMLNFVAGLLINFVATAPGFKDPMEGHPITIPLPDSALLGSIAGIPVSVLAAAATVAFVAVLLNRTARGYEIRAIGHNPAAAETYGIDFRSTLQLAFFTAGAIAGLGGALEIMNVHGRLIDGFTSTSGAQYGIFGILTALVVAGNPLAVPVSAFLMSVLLVGADSLQRTMRIPVELVFLTQALVVAFVVTIRQVVAARPAAPPAGGK
jgi:general nucleoside transport system permease protein